MDTEEFYDNLRTKANIAPKDILNYLNELLNWAKVFIEENSSVAEKLSQELFLSNLLEHAFGSNFSGSNVEADLLVSLIQVVELLLKRLHYSNELNTTTGIDTLRASEITSTIDPLEIAAEHKGATTSEIIDFDFVRTSPNYVTHYVAHHRDFTSLVIVVLWKNAIPGPAICHDDMPLLYVERESSLAEPYDEWGDLYISDSPVLEREYTFSEVQDAARVKQIISEHQSRLFAQHSNLIAIRTSVVDGICVIEFVVICKRFLPNADKEPLPRHLANIPTRVCSGWVELCGRGERVFHRPLLPGAGFAVGEDAKLNISEEEFVPLVLGTLGGFYVSNGVRYGVTCAHCIKMHGQANLHVRDTPIFQPSAMGLIVTAAYPHDLFRYENLVKTSGHYSGMMLLIQQLKNNDAKFSADLPTGSMCGVVHGGILGPLHQEGPVVDVALLRLADNVEFESQCASSPGFVKSPSLVLSDIATTNILEFKDYPRRKFSVFGRGARSDDTMEAIVNPLQSEIYFREVNPSGTAGLVFRCVHAVQQNPYWLPGDSGTWCWTADGALLGMGMARARIGGKSYCCILPMSDVLAAIERLME